MRAPYILREAASAVIIKRLTKRFDNGQRPDTAEITSGCVKQAAGTLRWFNLCFRPHMVSTAEMPCTCPPPPLHLLPCLAEQVMWHDDNKGDVHLVSVSSCTIHHLHVVKDTHGLAGVRT